jgi:hypothetical protein
VVFGLTCTADPAGRGNSKNARDGTRRPFRHAFVEDVSGFNGGHGFTVERCAVRCTSRCRVAGAPASDVARRIERAVAARLPAVTGSPASVCVKAGDGRVQLLVRHDGTTTRIVALCAPHLRERVDRALAQARFSLAAAGTPVGAA